MIEGDATARLVGKCKEIFKGGFEISLGTNIEVTGTK